MIEAVKKFIRELQESDDHRKIRWLWGSSSAAFIVVISLWAAYMRFQLTPVEPLQASAEKKSILATAENGVSVIYHLVKNAIRSENIVEIKKENVNFVFSGLENIPVSEFPKSRPMTAKNKTARPVK